LPTLTLTGVFLAATAFTGGGYAAEAWEPTPAQWELDPWLPAEGDSASRLAIPSLTQPYYNMVTDVHATVSAADVEFIFSTAGNWHSALRRLLNEQFFPALESARSSNLITTSPPISLAQMQTGKVKVGNVMYVNAAPQVVSGPTASLNQLAAEGYLSGPRINIISSYGNVILKRRGDQSIKSFWDLRTIKAGEFASADPAEGGSYNNYRNSVLNIALNNPRAPGLPPEQVAQEAAELQARLFDEAGVMTIGPPMHRSIPHLVASGEARAGLFFLHLAVTAMRENPGVFSAVYVAQDRTGETDDPDVLAQGQTPLTGNQVNLFQVSRTTTPVNAAQEAARDLFITHLQSTEFTQILIDSGLKRP
jgi:hypothetical protein